MIRNIKSLKGGELLQNVPNPFRDHTEIWFSLDHTADIIIVIADYTGKVIDRVYCGINDNGKHYVEYIPAHVQTGLYFYSLLVDGRITDTRKMNIIE